MIEKNGTVTIRPDGVVSIENFSFYGVHLMQAVAVDAVLDALERSEAANRGMVLNSLEAVPESEAA